MPALFCDNHPIAPPRTPEEGYHLTEDLVDQAIGCITDVRVVDPDKPFFLYLATGACHSPHQAPAPFIDRYRGAFDEGWDAWRTRALGRQTEAGVLPAGTELSPRPDWVPAWDDLSADERRLYARYMEAFAGFLSHTDHHLGRLFDFLRQSGELDNTVVLVLSDNGASSEGGPTGSVNDLRVWNGAPRTVEEALERIDEIGGPRCHNNYPWGWTVAGNTPFRRWKREVHEGGVADPLIVHWPSGIPAGDRWRRQYVHAVDVTPTVLEVLGVPAAGSHRRCDPVGHGRDVLRLHVHRARCARTSPLPVLRDARVPRPLRGRLEGGDVPPHPGHLHPLRRRCLGAVPRGRRSE